MPLEQAAGDPLLAVAESPPVPVLLTTRLSTHQIGDQWCWAACLQSALLGRGVSRRQGAIVRSARPCNPVGCNSSSRLVIRQRGCDLAVSDDEVAPIWCRHGFPDLDFREEVSPELGGLIRAQIAQDRPVLVWISARHLVLLQGYRVTSGGEEVLVMDPQRGVTDRWMHLEIHARLWTGWWTGAGFRLGAICA